MGHQSEACGRAIDRVLDVLRMQYMLPNPTGNGWISRCPAHDDRNPSLSIRQGDDGRVLLHCHAGCTPEQVVASIGMSMRDLFPEDSGDARSSDGAVCERQDAGRDESLTGAMSAYSRSLGLPSARWDYHDRDNQRVGIVLRWDTPDGKQIRPLSLIDRQWKRTGMPGPRPLYRLPELLESDGVVLVCEGEKAADAAIACAYTATTSPHGSKAARHADWGSLRGRDVVIVPDLDEAGDAYASSVHALISGIARSVKIIDLRDGWDALMHGDDLDDALCLCDGDADRVRSVVDGLIEQAPLLPAPRAEGAAKQAPGRGGRTGSVEPEASHNDLDAFEPSRVRWLVDGRIAMGKLNMLAGDPGLGKSFITLELASRVSRGEIGALPDGSAGRTIIMSAEDDPRDTLAPRLIAMGADRSRIRLFNGFKDPDGYAVFPELDRDAGHFARWLDAMGDVSLIVIDPISAYMGDTDSHKNAEVRKVLGKLSDIACATGAAVLCVSHLNKDSGSGKKAIYRTMGSLAFTAAARTVQLVTKYEDRNNPGASAHKRVVSMVKNNLGPMLPSTVYSIEDGRLVWHDEQLEGDADRFASGRAEFVSGETKGDRAVVFLEEVLRGGAVAVTEAVEAGQAMGFTRKMLEKTKREMGVIATKVGSVWYWSRDGVDDAQLIRDAVEPTPDDQPPIEFGDFGTY